MYSLTFEDNQTISPPKTPSCLKNFYLLFHFYTYVVFCGINFELTSIKQITLKNQGSTNKNVLYWCLAHIRSSWPEVFYRKGVLKNFAKFTGKHLQASTLLKKRLWHRWFPVNYVKFLRTLFFTEHLRWLLLKNETLFWRSEHLKIMSAFPVYFIYTSFLFNCW